MAKQKDPGLADFAVCLYGYQPLKIRATSLIVVDRWVYLRDAGGGILYAAPEANLHYVKRLEPGEAMGAPERLPEPEAADPGPIEIAGAFGPFTQIEPVAADDPQCTAPTTAGRRCRLSVVPGSDKCAVHA